MNNQNYFSNELNKEDNLNIRVLIEKYLSNWKWFVLGIVLALTGSYFYLRYSIPKYQASTSILIKDNKKFD